MIRTFFLMLGAVAIGCPALATAQTADSSSASARYIDPDAGLTVDTAIARALEHEPGLQGARRDIEIAEGQRAQAGVRPNPSVAFLRQGEPGGTDSQTRVEVQWPLDLARRGSRIRAAESLVDVSRLQVSARARELSGLVRQKYVEAAAAIQDLAVDETALALALEQQRLVAARVDQGAAPAVDRTVVDVDVRQLRAAQVIAIGRVERALVDLKRLLGFAPDEPVQLKGSLAELVQRDSAFAPASLDTRPDVGAARAQVDAADADVARARAEGRADVSLTGMYMRMDSGFPQQGFGTTGALEPVHGTFNYVAAGAMVTLPLLNRNQGSVAAAEAMKIKASSALAATRATAAAEIASARIRDEQARAALAIVGETRQLAATNVRVLQQAYQLGRATLLEVLEQQRRLVDVERQYSAALTEAFAARQERVQASGGVQ